MPRWERGAPRCSPSAAPPSWSLVLDVATGPALLPVAAVAKSVSGLAQDRTVEASGLMQARQDPGAEGRND